MGTFTDWKLTREGRFDNVDLGRPSIPAQVAAARRRLAETLMDLISEGELQPQMPLQDVIRYLQQ